LALTVLESKLNSQLTEFDVFKRLLETKFLPPGGIVISVFVAQELLQHVRSPIPMNTE